MKLSTILTAVVVVAGITYAAYNATASTPPPSKLTWHAFDKGLALAKGSNKKIMIDVYTDWCGWCKKMDSEVYTDPAVVRLLNDKFISVKLNAESDAKLSFDGRNMTETEFSQEAGVSGYPTILFLAPDGKPITIVPGYVKPDMMANILSYIGDDAYKTGSMQEYLSRKQ